jgi:hypothetical protein
MQDAINWLRNDITGSIHSLEWSLDAAVDSRIGKLAEDHHTTIGRLQETLAANSEAALEIESENAKHRAFEREALDSIQHRRKPRN